jgi:hypothetical protein
MQCGNQIIRPNPEITPGNVAAGQIALQDGAHLADRVRTSNEAIAADPDLNARVQTSDDEATILAESDHESRLFVCDWNRVFSSIGLVCMRDAIPAGDSEPALEGVAQSDAEAGDPQPATKTTDETAVEQSLPPESDEPALLLGNVPLKAIIDNPLQLETPSISTTDETAMRDSSEALAAVEMMTHISRSHLPSKTHLRMLRRSSSVSRAGDRVLPAGISQSPSGQGNQICDSASFRCLTSADFDEDRVSECVLLSGPIPLSQLDESRFLPIRVHQSWHTNAFYLVLFIEYHHPSLLCHDAASATQ